METHTAVQESPCFGKSQAVKQKYKRPEYARYGVLVLGHANNITQAGLKCILTVWFMCVVKLTCIQSLIYYNPNNYVFQNNIKITVIFVCKVEVTLFLFPTTVETGHALFFVSHNRTCNTSDSQRIYTSHLTCFCLSEQIKYQS